MEQHEAQPTLEAASGTGPAKRCPECGRKVGDASLQTTDISRRWRRIPLILTSVIFVAFLTWRLFAAETSPFGGGLLMPKLLKPPVSRAELEQIASSETVVANHASLIGTRILDAARRTDTTPIPGGRTIEVGFVDVEGRRTTTTTFGWPFPWFTRTSEAQYANAVEQTGFVPLSTTARGQLGTFSGNIVQGVGPRPRWEWQWQTLTLIHAPRPEETGGVEVKHRFRLAGIAAAGAIILLVWLAAAVSVRVVNLLQRNRPATRSIRGQLVASLATLSIIATLSILETRYFLKGRAASASSPSWAARSSTLASAREPCRYGANRARILERSDSWLRMIVQPTMRW